MILCSIAAAHGLDILCIQGFVCGGRQGRSVQNSKNSFIIYEELKILALRKKIQDDREKEYKEQDVKQQSCFLYLTIYENV